MSNFFRFGYVLDLFYGLERLPSIRFVDEQYFALRARVGIEVFGHHGLLNDEFEGLRVVLGRPLSFGQL
jgi:hypothetical protein